MFGASLTALELLRTKGIRSEYWKTWEKTTEMLPSTGQKQYEPNNSWLQNKQIEKGLKSRATLLGVERVERGSQLASAEWLPQEFRARVTKKSGQDWTSFGLEENLELYLIPEEALLLLELNCLELSWQGNALSIQQAHSVLLESDQRKSNKDEYRVYSHLVRQGYRLQRFRYGDGPLPYEPSIEARRSSTLKRKAQIHDPLNGFGMARDRVQADDSGGLVQDPLIAKKGIQNEFECGWETDSNPNSKPVAHGETIEKFIDSQSRSQSKNKLPSELYDNGVANLPGPSNMKAQKSFKSPDKNSMLPTVISDEIFLGELNIIANWPGARIQKNLGERSMEQNSHLASRIQDTMQRRVLEMTVNAENSLRQKRAMHEIIELSDEEIEEIPQKLSRMEMLNLFPNVISEVFVAKQIPKRYLPSHVRPQNISNQYVEQEVLNKKRWKNGDTRVILRSDLNSQRTDYMCQNGTIYAEQPVTDLYKNTINCSNIISQRGSCFHTDFFGRQSVHEKSQFLRYGHCHRQKHWLNMSDYHLERNRKNSRNISESSFKIVPGALSWAETKAKWLDERTITIEDEDYPNRQDSVADENEVKLLAVPGKPLVGVQNVASLAQVYQHLQIIKEGTIKNMRGSRKQKQAGFCKLSYNLYSTAQRFKKANPGTPMYRIAVLRSKNTPFIELVDMVGLQRDAKETPVVLAWASQSSVTFAEIGRVRIADSPDILSPGQLSHSL